MKLFSYLLVACAGLGLLACSTENDPAAPNKSNEEVSVSLKLSGIAGTTNTKAIESGTTASSTINLEDLRIIFYKASTGDIYRTEDFDSNVPADATAWGELISPSVTTGHIFHNIDPAVDAILVVGNWHNKGGTVASPTTNINWTNVTNIKSSMLLAAEENQSVESTPGNPATASTKNYVTLWGSTTTFGTGTFVDPLHTNVTKKTATINIAPLVARFEIGNIQCTDLGTHYKSFKLKGIGLVEMSLENNFNNALSTRLLVNTHISKNGVDGRPAIPYEFSNSLGFSGALDWSYNGIASLPLIDSNADIYNYDVVSSSPSTNGKFVYNFFPDTDLSGDPVTTNGFPNVRLLLTDVKTVTDVTSSFDYVATASFNYTSALIHPRPGYIYQVDLAFKEENIGPWNDYICVILNVTVAQWQILAVTPVYK